MIYTIIFYAVIFFVVIPQTFIIAFVYYQSIVNYLKN